MDSKPLLRRTSFLASLAVLVVIVAGADYLYFNGLETAAPPPPPPVEVVQAADGSGLVCPYDLSKPRIENYKDWISFNDPSLGNPDAPVTVIEFFDPNCPHCKTVHPLMKMAADSLGDRARFVFRPFVLGQGSLLQVEALHVAAQQGKFFEMMDAQFVRQNPRGLGMDDMREISAEIGLDFDLLKMRLDSQMYRSIALRQRQVAYDAGVTVVPTIMINGRIIDGSSRSLACFAQLIDEAS